MISKLKKPGQDDLLNLMEDLSNSDQFCKGVHNDHSKDRRDGAHDSTDLVVVKNLKPILMYCLSVA